MTPPDAARLPAPSPVARPVAADWKMRLEDPMSRYVRYPIARMLVRGLVKTPITPNQVTLVQPLLAAAAGWLITSDEPGKLVLAALAFEARAILDCADGTLARAKQLATPWGHAVDGIADWLGAVLLYAGIFWHFHLHPPSPGPWSAYISTNGILVLAIFQAATRSFAADYYKLKYVSIFERSHDETADALREKVAALRPSSAIFAHIDVFIGRLGRLAFEHEWFDPARSQTSMSEEQVKELQRNEHSALTKFVAALWSLSNGDAFLTLVCLTAALGKLWEGQLFFASLGVVWIYATIFLNGWFVRSASRRAKLSVAPAE